MAPAAAMAALLALLIARFHSALAPLQTLAAAAQQPHQGGDSAGGCDGCPVGIAGSKVRQRPGCALLHTLAAAAHQPHQGRDATAGCDSCPVGVVGSQIPQHPGSSLLQNLAAAT